MRENIMSKINSSKKVLFLAYKARGVGIYYGQEARQHRGGLEVGTENLKIPSHINLS